MFYSGANDKTLGEAVKRLSRPRRETWVSAFNAEYKEHGDEGAAHRAAWSVIRGKVKKMTIQEKAINIGDLRDEVARRLAETFPGLLLFPQEIFDTYLIAVFGNPEEPEYPIGPTPDFTYWKIPYTVTWKAVEGDPNELQVVDTIAFSPRSEWVQMLPTFVALKAFDQEDGKVRWLMVSSGCFEDRDGEVVSKAFLESALSIAEKSGIRGTLDVWHIPGSDIGQCDFQALVNGFLLESGTFDDTPSGNHAAQYVKEHAGDYGGSIQFYYVNRTPEGVYQAPGLIVRRSILPHDAAAFPWSAIALKEVDTMTVEISAAKRAELEKIVGSEAAAKILDGLDMGSEALKAAGVRYKEVLAPEGAPEDGAIGGDTPVVEEKEMQTETVQPVAAATPDAYEALLSDETVKILVAQVVKEVSEEQKATHAGTLEKLDNLTAALQKLSQDVAVLQKSDTERLAAMVKELPRATVKAIVRPSQAQPTIPAKAVTTDLAEIAAATLYGAK